MAFAWFNLGVRFVGGQFADGMRRVGAQSHTTVDGMRKDIARLTGEVRNLEKAESAAGQAVKAAKRAHDDKVESARRDLVQSQKTVQKIRDEMRAIQSVPDSKVNPAWRQWKERYDGALKIARQQSSLAHLERDRGTAAVAAARAERDIRLETLRATKAQTERDVIAARARVAAVKAGRPQGDDAVNPAWLANSARAQRVARDLISADLTRRQSGQRAQGSSANLRQLQRQVLSVMGVQIRSNADPTARLEMRNARDWFKQTGAISPIFGQQVQAQQATLDAAGERAGLLQIRAQVAGGRRFRLGQEQRRLAQYRPVRESEALRQYHADKVSAEADRSGALLRHEQAKAALGEAEIREAAKISAAEAARTAANTKQTAAKVAARERVDQILGREPAKDSAQAGVFQGLKERLVSAYKGLRAGETTLANAKSNTLALDAAKAQQEIDKQKLAVGRNALKLERDRLQQAVSMNAEMARTRTALRGHIMGQLFDVMVQWNMFRGMLRTIGANAGKAAEFEYKAQGISTLERGPRGTGQDVFAAYSRTGRYQGEVSPLEAVGRLGDLSAAGYTKAEMPGNAAAIYDLLLAARGEVTTAGAFDLAVSLDRQFGGKGRSMRDLLDTSARASNIFPMTIGKVRDMMGYAGEAAVQYDQPLEEMLMLGGMMMPINKTASKTGTSLRNALTSLAKPKPSKWLAENGIDTVDSSGQMRLVGDIFLDIQAKLDEVEARDGKVKRQALEYMLTGQRGGSIFAAMRRASESGSAALRGTPFEGMKFDSAKDAMEAMRLAIGDSADETRRMADEMRKTSYVLDLSFKASLERASIAAGTFLLPVRDAMQQMGKTLLDWISAKLGGTYDTPGGRAAGGSFSGNLLGIGVAGATAWMGLSTIKGVFSALSQVKLLTQTRTISAITAALQGGGDVGAAIAGTRTPGLLARMGSAVATAVPALGTFGTAVGAALGPLTLLTLGIGGAVLAFRAAIDAVTDFSDETRARSQSRQTKLMKAAEVAFGAAAEGRLSRTADGAIAGFTKDELRVIKAGGAPAAMLSGLLSNRNIHPKDAMKLYRQAVEAETAGTYSDPADRREQMKAWDASAEEYLNSGGRDIFDAILGGPGASKLVNLDVFKLWDRASNVVRAVRPNTKSGNERGGRMASLVAGALQETEAGTLDEAVEKMGIFRRSSFLAQLVSARNEQSGYSPGPEGWWNTVDAFLGGAGSNASREVLGEARSGTRLDLPSRRDQFTDKWEFFPRGRDNILGAGPLVGELLQIVDRYQKTGFDNPQVLARLEALLSQIERNTAVAPSAKKDESPNGVIGVLKEVAGTLREIIPSPTRHLDPKGAVY